jgi:hypothetical protein
MAGVKGQKSGGHSTAGTGAGRPVGIKKNKVKLGYKYTEEEADLIERVLEKVKEEEKTTSAAILKIFKFYDKNSK